MTVVPFERPARRAESTKRAQPGEAQAFTDILHEMEAKGRRALSVVFPADQSVGDLCAMLEEIDGAGWAVTTMAPHPEGAGLVLNLVLALAILEGGHPPEEGA